MAKTIIIFLALSVLVAHCHVLKNKELEANKAEHRGKRSCYVCESESQGPPPPPPPFFRHRWHWNSPGGGNDGHQEAFSAASSFANSGAGDQASGNYDGRAAGYGAQSAANSQALSGDGQNGGFGHHFHHSFQSGDNQRFEDHSGSAGGFGNPQKFQSGDFSAGRGSQDGFRGSQSSSSVQGGGGFGHGYNEQQGYGQGGAAFGAGVGSGQEALSGALNLASQGLQAAKLTSPSGCSTCDKGSYALSNAKSGSGNAIAVSVGR